MHEKTPWQTLLYSSEIISDNLPHDPDLVLTVQLHVSHKIQSQTLKQSGRIRIVQDAELYRVVSSSRALQ